MILKTFAQFISIVFHPLLVLTYMMGLLLIVNPYLPGQNQGIMLLSIFFTTFLIPMVGILMMRALNLISSLNMPERQERTIPYIMTGLFYIWICYNLYQDSGTPVAIKIGALGATIGLFLSFLFNLFTKISMHALGMGGLLGFTVLTVLYFSYNGFYLNTGLFGVVQVSTTALLMLVLFLTGLVCTCRMLLDAHTLQDLYAGFIVGLSTQFVATIILI